MITMRLCSALCDSRGDVLNNAMTIASSMKFAFIVGFMVSESGKCRYGKEETGPLERNDGDIRSY